MTALGVQKVKPTALFMALALLWGLVAARCVALWTSAPDYYHGWIVPILAVVLFTDRWGARPTFTSKITRWWQFWGAFGLAAFLATRFVLEAFPQWPTALWLHAAAALLVSLGILETTLGKGAARHFAFPFIFFFTALPWPEAVRQPIAEHAAGWIAQLASTIVNEFAGPAVRRGNVIEVAHGLLGVEEACTGLRSLESLVMAALFMGEFFRLSLWRRLALVSAGVALAVIANAIRATVLAWGAATRGIATVAAWHDSAGYAALAITLPALLFLGWRWRANAARVKDKGPDVLASPALSKAVLGLILAVAFVSEALPRIWFQSSSGDPGWTVQLPTEIPSFRRVPFTLTAMGLLQCEAGDGGEWLDANGDRRAAYFARWTRGHQARFALDLHNPTVCLPLAGARLRTDAEPLAVVVGGKTLNFRGWLFEERSVAFHVYSCAIMLPAGTPLPSAPITSREWLQWRWQTLANRERDENVLLVTVALWNPAPQPARLAEALKTEVVRLIQPARFPPGE